MKRRFEGFLAANGLIVLDTFTGDVKFVVVEEMTINNISIKSSSDEKIVDSVLKNTLSDFDNEVCTTFPYPIAKPYFDLINEHDSRQKCKLMVDTFTAVLKIMALQIASEYIRASEVKDMRVNHTLKRDIQRPLISAWNNVLLETIPVLIQNNVSFFSPELVRAYEVLETKCKNKVFIEKKYVDENDEIITKKSSLAKIQALIKYRNSLAHGFNQSKENAEKDLTLYLPILHEILENVRYMSRYTLWHVSSKNDTIDGIRLMGHDPKFQSLKLDRSLLDPTISPLFLVNESTMEVLPMFSFLDIEISSSSNIAETGKDIFLFDGNTENTIIYLSTSSGEHLEKKSKMKHWKELLKQKELELKLISEKDLNIKEICQVTSITTKSTIQSFVDNGKYIPEIVSKRDDFELYFEQFLFGNCNAIVIGGETGIGKSSLLISKVNEWENEGNPVLFYKASSFNSPEIGQKFVRDLGLKVNFPEDFFIKVDAKFKESTNFFFLVIDAINEYNSDVNLLVNEIESLVQLAKEYKWFRIVISVRDSSYKRLNSKFGYLTPNSYFTIEIKKGEDKNLTNIIPINRLNENLIANTYEKYREFLVKDREDKTDDGYPIFKPKTAFKDLESEGNTVSLLSSPLMMRLILQAFNRKELPSNLNIDKAMKIYFDEIILESNNPNGSFPLRKLFLSSLVNQLDSMSQDFANKEELLCNKLLKDAIINPQKDSAYVQLLDLGVLMEEWEEGDCIIRFSYDRLFEYLLAEEHFKKNTDPTTLVKLIERSRDFKSLTGSIQLMFLRLVMEDNKDKIIKVIDLLGESDDLIINLFVDFIKSIYLEDKNHFTSIINLFISEPTVNDLKILSGVLKSNIILNSEHTELLLNQMISISELLEKHFYKADALCLYGNHLMELNENKAALIELEKARIIYEENQIKEELPRIYFLIGRCQQYTSLYDIPEPEENHDLPSEYEFGEMEKLILEWVPADICWIQSYNKVIYYANQNKSKNVNHLLAASKLNIAWGYSEIFSEAFELYDGNNNIENAEQCYNKYVRLKYLEAVEIAKEIEDISSYSLILNNLASGYILFNKYQTALDYIKEALEKEDKIKDFRVLGYLYSSYANCEIQLGLISKLDWFNKKIKSAICHKKAGHIQNEIQNMLGFVGCLRNNVGLFVEIDEPDFGFVNDTILSLFQELTIKWTENLKMSSLKNTISKKDYYDLLQIQQLYCYCNFKDMNRLNKIVLEFEDDFIFLMFGIEIFSECRSLELKTEIYRRFLTIDFHHFEDLKIIEQEDEYFEGKKIIENLLNEYDLIVKDNWKDTFQFTKVDSFNVVDEEYLKKCLKNISWCTTDLELNEFWLKHKENIQTFHNEIKKQKNNPINFYTNSISLVDKMVLNKKINKKEMSECLNQINSSNFENDDIPPYAFFYRLIIYLNKHNDLDSLVNLFKINNVEILLGPEDWVRFRDIAEIRDKIIS